MLFLGLFLVSDLLGTTLPEEIWERVKADPVVKALAAQVRDHLFIESDAPLQFIERHAFHLRMRERLQEKTRSFLYLAMAPNVKDRAFLPLPRFLSPIYPLLRPIRLVRDYGVGGVKSFMYGLLSKVEG
jgi:hypothetical protein